MEENLKWISFVCYEVNLPCYGNTVLISSLIILYLFFQYSVFFHNLNKCSEFDTLEFDLDLFIMRVQVGLKDLGLKGIFLILGSVISADT